VKGRGLLWSAVLPAAVLLWLPVLVFDLDKDADQPARE
jgi:hypothetical protein